MRIGVLGCGQWGRNHARTLDRLGVLAGVADLDAERAAAVAAAAHTTATTPDRLLADSSVDGLVIALPPALHAAHALRALDSGKHVLVEKPMALDLADAARIAERALDRGLVAMTGHILRFHPAFEAIEAMARSGALGRLRHIETVRMGLGRSHAGSDAVMDLMPHDLSMIFALADLDAAGQGPVRGELLTPPGHEPAELRLAFAGGLTALSRASNTSHHRERCLSLRCEAGLVVFDDAQPWPRKLAVLDEGALDPRYIDLPEREPLAEELRHFCEAVAGAPVARDSAEEGLRVLTTLAQATRRTPRLRPAPPRPPHQPESRTA